METDEDLAATLRAQIDSHFEWLVVSPTGRTFPLTREEIDVRVQFGKVVLGVFDDTGFGVSMLFWRSLTLTPAKRRCQRGACGTPQFLQLKSRTFGQQGGIAFPK